MHQPHLGRLDHPLLSETGNDPTTLARTLDLLHADVPKLDVLVCAAGDEAALVGAEVHAPDGGRVRLDGLQHGRRGEVEQFEVAGFRTDEDLRGE